MKLLEHELDLQFYIFGITKISLERERQLDYEGEREDEVSSQNIKKQQSYIEISPTLISTLSTEKALFNLYAYKQSFFEFILIVIVWIFS